MWHCGLGWESCSTGTYAASTLGILLRQFTYGHTRQLAGVLRRHLIALAQRTLLLRGLDQRCCIDIDSLLRPVYGHAKQGASFGHTKIAGKSVLRRGVSPLATTISTAVAAPVTAGVRLRAGRAGSGRGAASMLVEAVNTGATFSFTLTRNPSVDAAIASIPHYVSTSPARSRQVRALTPGPNPRNQA